MSNHATGQDPLISAPPSGIAATDSCEDWLALGREVLAIEEAGIAGVRERLGQGFVDGLCLLAGCRGRVVVTGLGKSGLVGRKIAATLSSTGTPAYFLHPVEGAHGDLGMLRPEDVVLAISNSGETDELNAILPALRAIGVKVLGLTGGLTSTLARHADVVVDTRVEREACLLGLAPTASTTATLAVGDALAVCLIRWKSFDAKDFQRCHPGGALGQRLRELVGAIMHADNLPVVSERTPLADALRAMTEGRLGAVVAVDRDGRLAGILTDGDIRRMVCAGGYEVSAPLSRHMVRDPRRVTPDDTAARALDIMEEKSITVLPVVDQDRAVVGIVHLHDLLGKGRFKFSG
jgi:arabinose-5-phosphate isomerase